ncbi:MAG: hypothetical protein HY905_06740 [Deltaproteobacteria bacterium]|nr:hypothetical protein [Deltaproteobacteria bacterium]
MRRTLGTATAVLLIGGALDACGGDDAAGDAGVDVVDAGGDAAEEAETGPRPEWFLPDPEGRTTEGNLRDAEPEMVVVTAEDLGAAWQPYAAYRTLGGILTRVVTTEEVYAAAEGVDDAEALRNWLRQRWAAGALRFVLLGGDAEKVPYRRVEAQVTVPLGDTYTSIAPAEIYFGELEADWDGDGDGIWGERDQDLSLEDLRGPDVAVGRVPASRPEEVEIYRAKVEDYERDAFARATWPLFLSDVATSLPVLGDIDGAEALEITIAAFFPPEFLDHARRLYATDAAASRYGGEVLNSRRVAAALDEGFPLTFHNGHGSWWNLAAELDGDWVRGLTNAAPTIFASCACLSGNFADVADEPTFDGWEEQGPDDDSAGELLIVREHGAVGYLGNGAIGLGPVGGTQFLHEFYDAMFAQGIRRMGEAVDFGRAHMREFNLRIMGVPFNMTDASEWWTHLIVTLLGDPALEMWSEGPGTLQVTAPPDYGPGYNEVTVRVTGGGGEPTEGATVVLLKEGDFVLRATTGADGVATFRFVPFGPAPIAVRATLPQYVAVEATIEAVE